MDRLETAPICRSLQMALGTEKVIMLEGEPQRDPVRDFALSTAAGLSGSPRRLECRFLYDREGSELFERITEQPEYYLTRTETDLLTKHAPRIRGTVGRSTLIELGSGSSLKTRILLRAWLDKGESVRYVPVDVSQSALSGASRDLARAFPLLRIVALNADYRSAFPLFRELSPTLVLFLGSSIGNLAPGEMTSFLTALASSLSPQDHFLLGLDLVKEPATIEAAYNDAAGVSASFTRNIFARMNRELGSAVELDAIEHVASYRPELEQVEICARFSRRQTIRVAQLEKEFVLQPGETIQVEICRKFRLESLIPQLNEMGFHTREVFLDRRNWFALLLLRKQEWDGTGESE